MADKKAILGFCVFLILWAIPFSHSMAMPRAERTVLANKLTILVFEDHSIPAVTLNLLVSAGSWRDPMQMSGLANLTLKSLMLGTRSMSFVQINEKLDSLGATLDSECRKDLAFLGMQVLKKDLESGFGLFVEMMTAPSFPKADVGREKDNVIGKIRASEDQPIEVANRAFEKALFLNSPYAEDVEGTEQTLAGIGPDLLEKFYRSFYRPNNSLLVIGGDITPDEVSSRLVPALLKWEVAEIPETRYASEFAEGAVTVRIDKPVSQATIVLGNPAIDRAHKDYYAFAVMNHILGWGNLSSRLMTELRVKTGLAYAVESLLLARKHSGSFRVILQTKNASAEEALKIATAEMERIRQEPVSDAELEGAKKFLIGNFPLRFGSTQRDYAKFLAQVEFYNLGLDYPQKYPSLINAVTRGDVLRVAKQYLRPRDNVMAIVADLEKANMK